MRPAPNKCYEAHYAPKRKKKKIPLKRRSIRRLMHVLGNNVLYAMKIWQQTLWSMSKRYTRERRTVKAWGNMSTAASMFCRGRGIKEEGWYMPDCTLDPISLSQAHPPGVPQPDLLCLPCLITQSSFICPVLISGQLDDTCTIFKTLSMGTCNVTWAKLELPLKDRIYSMIKRILLTFWMIA